MEIDIGNYHTEQKVGTIDEDGNLETDSGALRAVAEELIEDGVYAYYPFHTDGREGGEDIVYREFNITPGTTGFLREFFDALPSPYDCDMEVLGELPTFDPDEYMDKLDKEWVEDPTEEAPNRWVNTTTGEYRYQETKPGSSEGGEEDSTQGREGSQFYDGWGELPEDVDTGDYVLFEEEEKTTAYLDSEDILSPGVIVETGGILQVKDRFGEKHVVSPTDVQGYKSSNEQEEVGFTDESVESQHNREEIDREAWDDYEVDIDASFEPNDAWEGDIQEESLDIFGERFGEDQRRMVESVYKDAWANPMRGHIDEVTQPIWEFATLVTGNEKTSTEYFGEDATEDSFVTEEELEAVENFAAHTQAVLRNTFGEKITAQRGLRGDFAQEIVEEIENDGAAELEHQALESYTTDSETASDYAVGEMAEDEAGVVIEQEIPVEEVISCGHTGGTEGFQSEFIVMKDGVSELSSDNIVTAQSSSGEEIQMTKQVTVPADENQLDWLNQYRSFKREDEEENNEPQKEKILKQVDKADFPAWCRSCGENRRMSGSFVCPTCHPEKSEDEYDGGLAGDRPQENAVGKDWVADPTDEAPNRWVNTATGEYRYQDSKPQTSSSSDEDATGSGETSDSDFTSTSDLSSGSTVIYGGEEAEVFEVFRDGAINLWVNGNLELVQVEDGRLDTEYELTDQQGNDIRVPDDSGYEPPDDLGEEERQVSEAFETDDVNLESVDEDMVSDALTEAAKMGEVTSLQAVSTDIDDLSMEIEKGVDAVASYNFVSQELYLDPEKFNDETAQKGHESGWLVGESAEDMLWHELGHAKTYAENSPTDVLGQEFTNEQAELVFNEVSKMAATSPHEMIAEVYTGLTKGKQYSDEVMQLYYDVGGVEYGA